MNEINFKINNKTWKLSERKVIDIYFFNEFQKNIDNLNLDENSRTIETLIQTVFDGCKKRTKRLFFFNITKKYIMKKLSMNDMIFLSTELLKLEGKKEDDIKKKV